VISARAVLESTDWGALNHAYDVAADVPSRLVGLLSEDPGRCADAVGYLDIAILHQGSIYPATPPVALFVAGILGDPRTAVEIGSAFPWDERIRPLRAALLDWLCQVGESAAWGERVPGAGWHDPGGERPAELDVIRACRAIRRDLYLAVAPFMSDDAESVRAAAIGAAGCLLAAPELADLRPAAAARLETLVRGASMRERAGIALALGRCGMAPGGLLADPDPAVRACAAVAPALDDDPAALAKVRRALEDPVTADSWFDQPIPQLEGKFRFALVAALLRRAATFEEIIMPALAIARMTNAYTVDFDWGPLLVKAFPVSYSPRTGLSRAQHQFLTAIAANDECWGAIANPALWLSRAGLPAARDALRELLASPHW